MTASENYHYLIFHSGDPDCEKAGDNTLFARNGQIACCRHEPQKHNPSVSWLPPGLATERQYSGAMRRWGQTSRGWRSCEAVQHAPFADDRLPEQSVHSQAGHHRGARGLSDPVQLPLQAAQPLPFSGRCLTNGLFNGVATHSLKGFRILAGESGPLVKIERRACAGHVHPALRLLLYVRSDYCCTEMQSA
jgi:hypothetical protein